MEMTDTPDEPRHLGRTTLKIRLYSGLVGVRLLPLWLQVWQFSIQSNIFTSIVLREGSVETRIMDVWRIHPIGHIAYVDHTRLWRYDCLVLAFRRSPFIFVGLVHTREWAKVGVAWLEAAGCRLTARAERLLQD
jgi:hypothetical protein